MSGQEDIRETVEKLDDLRTELRTKDLSLDEQIRVVSKGAKLFEKFTHHFSKSKLDVRVVRPDGKGELKEAPFDWDAFYQDEKRKN